MITCICCAILMVNYHAFLPSPRLQHAAQVPADAARKAAEVVEKDRQALEQEYGALEKQLSVSFSRAADPSPNQALTADSASKLLTLLLTLPHGVIKYSHTVPGIM